MTIRTDLANSIKTLGTATLSLSSATTTAFDFGTPNDLDLANNANYSPGDRIVVLFTAVTAGTTDTVSFDVQDAPDSSGSIGTPAAADTTGVLTGGAGDQAAIGSVALASGRPWLRARATSDGATDTFEVTCVALAVPRVL